VYGRTGSTWTEGPELTVASAVAEDEFGSAVALSGDGDTALVASALQGDLAGSVVEFDRSGATWTAQSPSIAPSDADGASEFGTAVALSGDASTALIGGPQDESQGGAAWAFSRQTAPAVTAQPVSQTVTAPAPAAFTAAASGVPAPTVQWQVSADGGTTWSSVPGATSTTLTVSPTATAQNGDQYRAVFTNPQGSATTDAATLSVRSPDLPVVTAVNPSSGFSFFFVFIRGQNFRGTQQVDFGPGHPTLFAQLSSSLVVALAPPQGPGSVDVTVRTAGGTSATSSADRFTYLGAAAVRGAIGRARR